MKIPLPTKKFVSFQNLQSPKKKKQKNHMFSTHHTHSSIFHYFSLSYIFFSVFRSRSEGTTFCSSMHNNKNSARANSYSICIAFLTASHHVIKTRYIYIWPKITESKSRQKKESKKRIWRLRIVKYTLDVKRGRNIPFTRESTGGVLRAAGREGHECREEKKDVGKENEERNL